MTVTLRLSSCDGIVIAGEEDSASVVGSGVGVSTITVPVPATGAMVVTVVGSVIRPVPVYGLKIVT